MQKKSDASRAKRARKPEPQPTRVVCTLCELDWDKHTAAMKTSDSEPTAETCIELLKAELAKRPAWPSMQAYVSGIPLRGGSGIPQRGNDIGKVQ